MLRWLKSGLGLGGRGSTAFPGDTALDAVRYVVLDTELTSLDKRSNRLLSIGAIAMDGPKIRLGEQFYRIVNPGVPVPAESVVIHKLRSADVEGGEDLGKALEDLRRFVEGAVLVGHFVNVDLKILWKELGNRQELSNPAVDTARVHHWILRQGRFTEDLTIQLERLDLMTLTKFYGLDFQDAHHALSDAFMTAQVWQKMMSALQAKGIRKLSELLRIGGA
jgi:DNA polymerase III subunit epsilon